MMKSAAAATMRRWRNRIEIADAARVISEGEADDKRWL